jgi:hypothetical protein
VYAGVEEKIYKKEKFQVRDFLEGNQFRIFYGCKYEGIMD